MLSWFFEHPGRLFVTATLLPLGVFTLLLVAGLFRALSQRYRKENYAANFVYYLFGGDTPLRAGAFMAIAGIALAAVFSVIGLVLFLQDVDSPDFETHWKGRISWVEAPISSDTSDRPALHLEIGYRVDHLTAVLFSMVTVVATCIFIFSLGYMHDETVASGEWRVASEEEAASGEWRVASEEEALVSHEEAASKEHSSSLLATRHSPLATIPATIRRKGRFGRFYLYLSLFCFSMLNLLIADNLFQVFISWELVGICSFLLIGFYYERRSASTAANKAFLVNRVGDLGLLIALAIFWCYCGTFNFKELFERVRCPLVDAQGDKPLDELAGKIVRCDRNPDDPGKVLIRDNGREALILPKNWHAGTLEKGQVSAHPFADTNTEYQTIPYWLLVVAGLGIFLGCVGKSAQFPLQTWLPDAMEGPTPVSALIHAATMVAAGVYLVGRCYPLFTPEVLLAIAYTGVSHSSLPPASRWL